MQRAKSGQEVTIPLLILFVGIFFGFYFNLGGVPLFDLDEGAFGEATREMVASGNYLTTYLNGELRFDKPILIYWLQALSLTLFGHNEFALRLPSSLAATLWVFLLYRFAGRYFSQQSALMAAFMMSTSLQIGVIAKAAIADSLLNLLIAATMFLLYEQTLKPKRSTLYGIYILIALGALTKGPVAIMIPLVVSFLFLVSTGRFKLWIDMVFDLRGIALFILVAAPWYILEYLDQGQKFIDGFFFKHNLNRFNTSFEGHSGSLLYYIPVLLAGMLPYTTLLVRAFVDIKQNFSDDLMRFLLIWALFVLLFFSFSGTKLPHYVIYGYTPLFILMALVIPQIKSDKTLLLPPLFLFVLLFVLPLLLPFIGPTIKHPFTRLMLEDASSEFGWQWYLFFASLTILTLWLMRTRTLGRNSKLIAIGLATVFAMSSQVFPTYAAIAQAPIKEAALLAKSEGVSVHLWKLNTPSFIFYREMIVSREKPDSGEVVLTRKNHLVELGNTTILYEKHGIILAEVK